MLTSYSSFKRFLLIFISLLVFGFFALFDFTKADLFAETAPRDVKVGVYDNKPKVYRDSNGKAAGFYPDILDYIAGQENWRIDYVHGTFDEGLTRLKNGEINIMVDVALSDERKKEFDFTNESVLNSWGVVLVRKDSNINTFTDLNGKKIAILNSSVYLTGPQGLPQYLESFGIDAQIVKVNEYAQTYELLNSGAVDAAVDSRISSQTEIKNYPNIKFSNIIFSPTELRFALTKGSPSNAYFIEKLDYWLGKLKSDPSSIYYQSLQKEGLGGIIVTKPVTPTWFVPAIIGGVILFLILLYIIIRLLIRRAKYIRELAESEKKFHSMFDSMSEIVVLHEVVKNDQGKIVDFRIVDCNPAFSKVSGISREEAVGELTSKIYGKYEMPYLNVIIKAFNEDAPFNFEGYFDTIQKYLKVSVFSPIPGRIAIIADDITERKKFEADLQKSNREIQTIYNQTTDILYNLSVEGESKYKFISANKTFYKATGLKQDQVIGKYVTQVIPEPSLSLVLSKYKEAIKQKNIVNWMEITKYPKETKYGDVSVQAIYDKNGICTNLIGTVHDITESEKAKRLLIESERRFRKIFENGQFGIILVDKDNKFIRVNPAFSKITGYSEEELLNMRFSDITTPDSIKEDLEAAKNLRAGKISTYTNEKRYYKKDGDIVWVKIVVSVVNNPDKTFGYFLTMVEDITRRKLEEEALQKSEDLLKESQKVAGLGSYALDIPSQKWESSEVLDRLFGIGKSFDRTVKSWIKLIHPDDRKMMSSYFSKEVVGKGLPFDKEYRIVRPVDHKTRWLHGLGSLTFNGQKHPIKMVGTIQDITEAKKIREELIASNDKFTSVFQSSPYALTLTQLSDGKFIDVNDAFVSLTGISRKQALASSSIGLGVWSNKNDRNKMIAELKAKGEVSAREFPFKTESRGVVWGLYSARIIYLNKKPFILSSIADLSALRAAEAKVLELKDRDEAVLVSIGDGVFACDINSNIVLFNKVAESLTGITAKEAIGQKYNKVLLFIDENDGEPGPDFVKEAITKNKTTKMVDHMVLLSKDGRKIPVADSASPIRDLEGKVTGCVVVFHDVTQERAVDTAKTEFVSLASHQLRTPLTAINWYCEMLLSKDGGPLTEKQREYASETYSASKRMVRLMNALLNVSRLEMGSFTIEPKVVNIVSIAKTSVKELMPQIEKKMIKLTQKYDSNVGTVDADPKLLSIIFENLLSNAVKYVRPKGKIALHIRKQNGSLYITVADNGIGIPKEQQSKMFTKLFRADNVRQIDPEGSGLGLYMVKTILDNSGGKIWFESDTKKGTTFYVTMPVTGMKKKGGTKRLI